MHRRPGPLVIARNIAQRIPSERLGEFNRIFADTEGISQNNTVYSSIGIRLHRSN
jgi:hypothetical protein